LKAGYIKNQMPNEPNDLKQKKSGQQLTGSFIEY